MPGEMNGHLQLGTNATIVLSPYIRAGDLQLYLPITSVLTCQATVPLLHDFSHWSE